MRFSLSYSCNFINLLCILLFFYVFFYLDDDSYFEQDAAEIIDDNLYESSIIPSHVKISDNYIDNNNDDDLTSSISLLPYLQNYLQHLQHHFLYLCSLHR